MKSKHASSILPQALAVLFSLTVAVGQSRAAVVSYTRPNTNDVSGPVTNTMNGTTFINLGMQGVGRLSASMTDAFGDTFGSVSSMVISDWQKTLTGYEGTFYTLPDRGFNSGTFFSDFAARIQQLEFTFTPYTNSSPLGGMTTAEKAAAQNQIVATYIDGTKLTIPGGNYTTGLDPTNNTTTLFGKVLPFVPSQVVDGTNYPVNKITLDSEGLVLRVDGSGWISDEYGANAYYFDSTKQIIGVITPPSAIQPHAPTNTLNFDSVNPPINGRRNNQGMEGMALSPDGNTLFLLLQSATVQDSTVDQQTRLNTRLLLYDVSSGNNTPTSPFAEYVLQLPIFRNSGNGSSPNRTAAQSELIALSDCKLLVLSRDGNGNGSASANQAVFKSILLVDLDGATNIAGTPRDDEGGQVAPSGVLDALIVPMNWVEAVNMLNTAELTRFNFNLNNASPDILTISEKWEGLSLVSALDPENPDDYFLFVANDNDFITADGTMLQGDGSQHAYDAVTGNLVAENDTVFLAYRVRILLDTVAPTITCPDDISVSVANGTSEAMVSYPDPTANDNCASETVTIACDPPSGSTFPVGTTSVACTAIDAAGNPATCTFNVTVVELACDSIPALINKVNQTDLKAGDKNALLDKLNAAQQKLDASEALLAQSELREAIHKRAQAIHKRAQAIHSLVEFRKKVDTLRQKRKLSQEDTDALKECSLLVIQGLIGDVADLSVQSCIDQVNASSLPADKKNQLLGKLTDAQQKLTEAQIQLSQNKYEDAQNKLADVVQKLVDYITLVNQYQQQSLLTPEDAQSLKDCAQTIIDAIVHE